MYEKILFYLRIALCIFSYGEVFATLRYMSSYNVYGSGDTVIQVFHAHGGPLSAYAKWSVECLDGEALVGIQDWFDDFVRLQAVWCKFIFTYKPPSQGRYPYYPSCHVRNYTTHSFCFDAQRSLQTVNTFITAVWDNEFQFNVWRPGPTYNGDDLNPFKCCKTPDGYYIDYTSCYYVATRDMYWEYYDSTSNFIVQCGTGFVMTGISKKANPYQGDKHIEWIQCCRIGYGEPVHYTPPVTTLHGIRSLKTDSEDRALLPVISDGYQAQYQKAASSAPSYGRTPAESY